MSDEAVVRIVLQDEGGSGGAASAGSSSPAASGWTDQQAKTLLNQWKRFDELARLAYRAELNVAAQQQAVIDVQAKSILDRAQRYDELARLAYQVELDIAKKQKEEDAEHARTIQQRAERYDELARLAYKAELEVARKKAAEVFDPVGEAHKRRESEIRREKIEAEYQRLYGKPEGEKSTFDAILEIADSLRGVIGGIGGKLIGAAVDIASAARKAQVNTQGGSSYNGANTSSTPSPSTGGPGAPSSGTSPSAGTTSGSGGGPPSPPGSAGGAASGGFGGAAGGAAAAIPVVGVALAAKAAIDAISTQVISGIKSAIGGAGGIANAIADPNSDPSVPIGKIGNAVTETGERFAKLVPTLGWAIVAVGETTKAFASLMQAIDGTAQRYGEYSPQIAQAQAMVEVRQTLGDLRRSQEIGNEMAKYVIAQGELQQKFEDVKVKLLTKMLPFITKALEILEAIVPSGQGIEYSIGTCATPLIAIANALTQMANMSREEKVPVGKDPAEMLKDVGFETIGTGRGRNPGLVPRL